MLKVFEPLTTLALAGNTAFGSVELIPTTSLVLTTFQFASTALTLIAKEAPAVCVIGVPVFPLTVPGAAVSPGSSNCNRVNVPEVTAIAGLVFDVFVGSLESEAVNVCVPAVIKV